MNTSRPVVALVGLFVLTLTACAPAVPDFDAPIGESAAASGAADSTTITAPEPSTTTTTAAPPETTSTTTTSSTTTTTVVPVGPVEQTVGAWSLSPESRDESGTQFEASVTAPALVGDVDTALQARVNSLVDGHIESQIGATLALWRSIEGQGDRDLTGSTLTLEYEVAGFVASVVAFRFFSDEQVSGSGGSKRQATTLMIDLVDGVSLGLDDVVLNGESRAQLLPLVQDGLLTGYFGGDQDAFSLWAGNLTAADLDDAALSDQGIEVWFDELEVGPPDIGTPVVLVPYDALDGIVDPQGPAAAFFAS
ncbi:MAG: hypothetical protein HKN91_08965 [Acidimicrobiia bacterium]|nr:hypothetical protein [Acidimicrobiia bacterium]